MLNVGISKTNLIQTLTHKDVFKKQAEVQGSTEQLGSIGLREAGNADKTEGDSVTLSEEGQAFAEQENDFLKMLEEQAQSAQASGEDAKTLAKCMKIAISIMRGDVVPMKDQQYLQKNNEELFAQAMKMRMPKEKPEKCKSVLEDEEENTNCIQASSSAGESSTTTGDNNVTDVENATEEEILKNC